MTLANEMRDFLEAYTAMREVGFKQRREDRADREFESNDEYRNAMLEIQQARLGMEQERHAARTRGRVARDAGGTGGAPGTTLPDGSPSYLGSETGGVPTRPTVPDGTGYDLSESSDRAELRLRRTLAEDELENYDDTFEDSLDDLAPPATAIPGLAEQFQDFKRGGMVRPKYERGGMIPRDDEDLRRQTADYVRSTPTTDNFGRTPQPGATPTVPQADRSVTRQAPQATPAPSPDSSPNVDTALPISPSGRVSGPAARSPAPQPRPDTLPDPSTSRVIVERSREATDRVVRMLNRDIEAQGQAVGADAQNPDINPFAPGGERLPPQVLDQVAQTIDPNRMLPPHVRNMAMVAEAYSFYAEQGDVLKGERMAAAILTTQMDAARTLGTLALSALETGDHNTAVRLLNDAADRFPTEHEIIVRPDERDGAVYEVRDFDGNTVEEGRLNSTQLWEMTGRVANGQAYVGAAADFIFERAQDTRPRSAEAAIDASNQAFVDLMQAREQYQILSDGGADREELEAARATAEGAMERYNEVTTYGVEQFDLSRAEIESRNRFAIGSALDPLPPEEDNSPGPIRRGVDALFGGGGGEETPSALPGPSTRPQPRPAAAVRPAPVPQPATQAAPATSPGNASGGAASIGAQIPGMPAPGDVIDGYRFRGGDPSRQENWVAVGG